MAPAKNVTKRARPALDPLLNNAFLAFKTNLSCSNKNAFCAPLTLIKSIVPHANKDSFLKIIHLYVLNALLNASNAKIKHRNASLAKVLIDFQSIKNATARMGSFLMEFKKTAYLALINDLFAILKQTIACNAGETIELITLLSVRA
jgi:hypothetical protein